MKPIFGVLSVSIVVFSIAMMIILTSLYAVGGLSPMMYTDGVIRAGLALLLGLIAGYVTRSLIGRN
jgi:hypothetical protein